MNEDDTKRSNSGKPIKNGGSNLENNLKLNPPSHLSVKFSTSDVDSESKHSSHQDNNNDDKFNSEKEIGVSFVHTLMKSPAWEQKSSLNPKVTLLNPAPKVTFVRK